MISSEIQLDSSNLDDIDADFGFLDNVSPMKTFEVDDINPTILDKIQPIDSNTNQDNSESNEESSESDNEGLDEFDIRFKERSNALNPTWKSSYGFLAWVRASKSYPWWPSFVCDPKCESIIISSTGKKTCGILLWYIRIWSCITKPNERLSFQSF